MLATKASHLANVVRDWRQATFRREERLRTRFRRLQIRNVLRRRTNSILMCPNWLVTRTIRSRFVSFRQRFRNRPRYCLHFASRPSRCFCGQRASGMTDISPSSPFSIWDSEMQCGKCSAARAGVRPSQLRSKCGVKSLDVVAVH